MDTQSNEMVEQFSKEFISKYENPKFIDYIHFLQKKDTLAYNVLLVFQNSIKDSEKQTLKNIKEYFSVESSEDTIKMLIFLGFLRCFFAFYSIPDVVEMMKRDYSFLENSFFEYNYFCRIPENFQKGAIEIVVLLSKETAENIFKITKKGFI